MSSTTDDARLFGHPTGLFTLFFAEMWERFSYYGMRALLVFYMIKGFLGYNDEKAYAVYGAYTALVYATPFIGGMLADRLLGARRAVVIGGLLMAAGHLLMTWENSTAFFLALALLIVGNGFFKPNISVMVGSLYPEGSAKKDGGFTIFYMGINLGAAMSPLLCGYIGETYGWHYGFGLATVGMLIGLAVFVAPVRLTQYLILLGALGTAVGMFYLALTPKEGEVNMLLLGVNGFVAIALAVAGAVSYTALGRGGLPDHVGRAPTDVNLDKLAFPGLRESANTFYLALIAAGILVFDKVVAADSYQAWLLFWAAGAIILMPWLKARHAVWVGIAAAVPIIALLVQRNEVAGTLLTVFGGIAFASIVFEAFKATKIERERLFVVLILMFFSMLFWAFFEQAGSSVNNFTDRNVDRVVQARNVTEADVGKTIDITMNQEQLGYSNGDVPINLTALDRARDADTLDVKWQVDKDDVGMGVEGTIIPASVFQSANPIYIMIFGLVFTGLWGFLGARGLEPSTPVKFALGLVQLGLGFGAFWYGAQAADGRGMVWMGWLLLGYLLWTTGELCLSPVGLSMVTKLSPKRIVSTVMGAWFLATAFSNYLAGLIAMLTGVSHGGGEEGAIPMPSETVGIYGDVFGKIAIAALASGAICLVLSPLLTKWMHEGEDGDDDGSGDDAEAPAPDLDLQKAEG